MRGTEDAHVLLQTAILDAFALKQRLAVVYFDVRKAYDTTWRHGILQAVHRCGIRGKRAIFIQNFKNKCLKLRLDSFTKIFYSKNRGFPKAVSSVVTSLHWPLMTSQQ